MSCEEEGREESDSHAPLEVIPGGVIITELKSTEEEMKFLEQNTDKSNLLLNGNDDSSPESVGDTVLAPTDCNDADGGFADDNMSDEGNGDMNADEGMNPSCHNDSDAEKSSSGCSSDDIALKLKSSLTITPPDTTVPEGTDQSANPIESVTVCSPEGSSEPSDGEATPQCDSNDSPAGDGLPSGEPQTEDPNVIYDNFRKLGKKKRKFELEVREKVSRIHCLMQLIFLLLIFFLHLFIG